MSAMSAVAAPLGLAGSSFAGQKVQSRQTVTVTKVAFSVQANKVKKGINMAKKNGAVNTGVSEIMKRKDWVDPQGRKGKGYGVYRFNDKYGANVDGYSPIWSPNEWSETGDTYKAGLGGLAIWLGLLGAGLGFAGYLIYSTSAL
eukprot:CAMPEP_0198204558 /NCGR_PEP_ID=MMETSP1445-20131203/7959_1 /TAXON_ID=36898 /ORGANISM="Pyramimonas sp., Strain CCMP2087" /LENGTH=143 /DNA_ID=CAMNT_0043876485 /DNA_START=125 /DNA_END=556 /DNA_ORIENTATION=+